jgi:hypothetical protein
MEKHMTNEKTHPDKIFLRWGGDGLIGDFHTESMDITWCTEQISDDDVEYVRADIVDKNLWSKIDRLKSVLFSILAIVRDPENRGSKTLRQQCRLMDRINDMIEQELE